MDSGSINGLGLGGQGPSGLPPASQTDKSQVGDAAKYGLARGERCCDIVYRTLKNVVWLVSGACILSAIRAIFNMCVRQRQAQTALPLPGPAQGGSAAGASTTAPAAAPTCPPQAQQQLEQKRTKEQDARVVVLTSWDQMMQAHDVRRAQIANVWGSLDKTLAQGTDIQQFAKLNNVLTTFDDIRALRSGIISLQESDRGFKSELLQQDQNAKFFKHMRPILGLATEIETYIRNNEKVITEIIGKEYRRLEKVRGSLPSPQSASQAVAQGERKVEMERKGEAERKAGADFPATRKFYISNMNRLDILFKMLRDEFNFKFTTDYSKQLQIWINDLGLGQIDSARLFAAEINRCDQWGMINVGNSCYQGATYSAVRPLLMDLTAEPLQQREKEAKEKFDQRKRIKEGVRNILALSSTAEHTTKTKVALQMAIYGVRALIMEGNFSPSIRFEKGLCYGRQHDAAEFVDVILDILDVKEVPQRKHKRLLVDGASLPLDFEGSASRAVELSIPVAGQQALQKLIDEYFCVVKGKMEKGFPVETHCQLAVAPPKFLVMKFNRIAEMDAKVLEEDRQAKIAAFVKQGYGQQEAEFLAKGESVGNNQKVTTPLVCSKDGIVDLSGAFGDVPEWEKDATQSKSDSKQGASRYHVVGIQEHRSNMLSEGHYVSYTCVDGKWLLVDDEKVTEVTFEQAIAQASLVCLQRVS
ncbi:MAG: ubiquitin carboxyl-terminal hydrolase [Parachlamydiaceae bacterium]|nr:ubiquitin carboxyl-terminal hydrolase [Parachlamydiaceae bacterium]